MTVAVGRGEYWFRKSIKTMLKLTITNNCNNFNTLVKGDYCLTLNEQFFQLYHGDNKLQHKRLSVNNIIVKVKTSQYMIFNQIKSELTEWHLTWSAPIEMRAYKHYVYVIMSMLNNCVICQILYALLTDGTC